MIATIADPLSDAMLAIAALYVSFQALRGYRRERKAATEHDPDEKKSLLEDAQTLYASASLSLPWVLWFIFLGTAIKAMLLVSQFAGVASGWLTGG